MPVPRIPCFLIWEKSLVVLCGFRDKFDDRIFGARLVFLPCGTSTERRGKSLDSGRSGILCPYWTVVKNVLSSRGTRRKRVIFRERSAGESKSTCGCASCVYVRVWVRCYMLKTCRVKLTRDCNDINPVPVSFRGRSRSVVRAFLRRFPISPNALDVGETRSAREQTAPAKRTARSKAPCCLLLHSRCVVICPLYYNAGPLFFFSFPHAFPPGEYPKFPQQRVHSPCLSRPAFPRPPFPTGSLVLVLIHVLKHAVGKFSWQYLMNIWLAWFSLFMRWFRGRAGRVWGTLRPKIDHFLPLLRCFSHFFFFSYSGTNCTTPSWFILKSRHPYATASVRLRRSGSGSGSGFGSSCSF